MIIIVEGIDRVGKTTLCQKLSDKLQIPILKDYTMNRSEKTQSITKEIANEKILTGLNFLKALGKRTNIIIDRFHVSEWVYGQASRGYINDFMLEIDKELKQLDAMLIVVKPNNLRMSIANHGRDLTMHHNLFVEYYNEKTSMLHLSCTYDTMDKVVTLVEAYKEWIE